MIHRIRDKLLNTTDLGRRTGGQVKVHIHIVHIASRVDRDFVLGQLLLVVEGGPVIGRGEDFGRFFDLREFGVGVEHVFEDLRGFSYCFSVARAEWGHTRVVLTISPVKRSPGFLLLTWYSGLEERILSADQFEACLVVFVSGVWVVVPRPRLTPGSRLLRGE